MAPFEFAWLFLFSQIVIGLPIDHLNRKISELEVAGVKPSSVNKGSCNSAKCAGVCVGGVCKVYSLIGEECGGDTGKNCVPCQVCVPNIMGLNGSKGVCRERLRCNNQWCDGGFCFVTNKKTGETSSYKTAAPPLTSNFTHKCVKYSQYGDRCSGAITSPPTDFQYCPEPLQCFRGARMLDSVYGVCRLPVCEDDLCVTKGQQFIDGYCGLVQGKLCCQKYKEEGETCGGLGPNDLPLCNPSEYNCAKEGKNKVCRASECLKTCTGEFCLPDENGTSAICGGTGAPPPTTPRPTYYGGGPSYVEVEMSVKASTSQLPPICCASKSPIPPAPTWVGSFLELAALHSNQQGCCPASALCPQAVGIACTPNPAIVCASCASAGLYQTPCPPPTYSW